MNPQIFKDPSKTFRLGHGPRKAIEHEAIVRVISLQGFTDDSEDHLVGHQLAGIHEALRLAPHPCSFPARMPQDISGGETGDTEKVFEDLSLCSLSRTRRAHQYDSHQTSTCSAGDHDT